MQKVKVSFSTKCFPSIYLGFLILASFIFLPGCATQIEWAPRNPSMKEVEETSRATTAAVNEKLSRMKNEDPKFHQRLESAVSDDNIVITDSYTGKVYIGR